MTAREVLRRALCSQTRSCEKAGFGSALCGVCSIRAEDLLAALAAAGLAVVPKEATERMVAAATWSDMWRAMVAASQDPPA